VNWQAYRLGTQKSFENHTRIVATFEGNPDLVFKEATSGRTDTRFETASSVQHKPIYILNVKDDDGTIPTMMMQRRCLKAIGTPNSLCIDNKALTIVAFLQKDKPKKYSKRHRGHVGRFE